MCIRDRQYHGLVERGKSANDASISRENFVKLGPVTSELTVLICERVTTQPKTGVFRGISPDILHRFSQSFYRMKVLYVQMMD